MPEEDGVEGGGGLVAVVGQVALHVFLEAVAVHHVQGHQQQDDPPDVHQQGEDDVQEHIPEGDDLDFIVDLQGRDAGLDHRLHLRQIVLAPGLQVLEQAQDALVALTVEKGVVQILPHQGRQGLVPVGVGAQAGAVDQVPGAAVHLDDQEHVRPAQLLLGKVVLGVGLDVLAVEVIGRAQGQHGAVGVVQLQVAAGQGVGGVQVKEPGIVLKLPQEIV